MRGGGFRAQFLAKWLDEPALWGQQRQRAGGGQVGDPG